MIDWHNSLFWMHVAASPSERGNSVSVPFVCRTCPMALAIGSDRELAMVRANERLSQVNICLSILEDEATILSHHVVQL